MTTNRLAKSNGNGGRLYGYTAREWAIMAREKHDLKRAEEWEKAEREGWDFRHFSQVRRDELEEKNPGAFNRFGMIGQPSN